MCIRDSYTVEKQSMTTSKSECSAALLQAKDAIETVTATFKDNQDQVQATENKISALQSSKRKKEKDSEKLRKEMRKLEQELTGKNH